MCPQLWGAITKMFTEGELKKAIRLFSFNENPSIDYELKQDFEQDLILILAEYGDCEKLIAMHERGELFYYVLGIVKRSIFSQHSPYWTRYGRWYSNREEFSDAIAPVSK